MEMSNAIRKVFASLATAKGRREHGLFMAQGTKCVTDTLQHFQLEALLATNEWAQQHTGCHPTIVKPADIQRISTLQTPPQVIAIYHLPAETDDLAALARLAQSELMLALDCIQDPGNLGTIMRVADWMGVRHIVASPDTADVWSPKVVQATMGAISRVKVVYAELPAFLRLCAPAPIYGTFLNGENIYEAPLSAAGVIVMGNEGRGIGQEAESAITHRLTIPPYPADAVTSESLNVAIATAITLSEFRRHGQS